MIVRIGEMRNRDVISIRDGARIGFLGDIEFDAEKAQLIAVVVYGRARFFGLLGHEDDCVIPWQQVRTMGEDAVLVDFEPPKRPPRRHFWTGWLEER